jgi:regulatory protein
VWHKNGAMAHSKAGRTPRPLNEDKLQELALRYVGRFATTRAKLRSYLQRKLRERGWDGDRPPDADAIVERFAELGYVDDAGYALGKSRALTARGYGKRRVVDALRVAGVDDSDGEAARELAERDAIAAALRFAQKRRLGPFSDQAADDPRVREKAIAALVRAGHGFALARAIVELRPDEAADSQALEERLRLVLP